MGVADPVSPAPVIEWSGASLLLVTPHPDDEALALGGLIQHAVREGARITLVQVTDGDNNPWPQRWLERRWRIGPEARRRWARRRADEVDNAIRHLGLPAACLQRLGWPDLGVTKRLCDTPAEAIRTFADVVQQAAPDIVVMPDLDDRHPDHSASHVLLRLALARLDRRPTCLTYLVHGGTAQTCAPWVLALDPAMREAKRQAVLAHRTQVALARRRLLAMVGPSEHLYRLQPPEYLRAGTLPGMVALPWHPSPGLQPSLRLTVAKPDGVQSWPWRRAPLRRNGRLWELALPVDTFPRPVFAKLEMRCTSPWIFDRWGWCDLTAVASAGQAGR